MGLDGEIVKGTEIRRKLKNENIGQRKLNVLENISRPGSGSVEMAK